MPSHPLIDRVRRHFMRIVGSGLAVVALAAQVPVAVAQTPRPPLKIGMVGRSEEHTSELQSL